MNLNTINKILLSVFAATAVTLTLLTWYSRKKRSQTNKRSEVKKGQHVTDSKLLVQTSDDLECVPLSQQDDRQRDSITVDQLPAQNTTVDKQQLCYLVKALDTADRATLKKMLVTLGNAAAFTHNQNVMREEECLPKLTELLKTFAVSTNTENSEVLISVINVINNLSMNDMNQEILQESIPVLIEITANKSHNSTVHLASLQALTNLSVKYDYHTFYQQMIQNLYDRLASNSSNLKQQALKILVNLSSNPLMVPHLLAAKAPPTFADMLDTENEELWLLRWTTFLGNCVEIVKRSELSSNDLPFEYKAASPETMYCAIYGFDSKVKSKIFRLTRECDESIKTRALRVYVCL